ncbi:alginate lyase [Neiella marina]|uniref:Alginate lyase n=1 Tax=Neiella holothuriorum TaxID=2870530 RepID=A0ABS7ED26_9GAMM|nr:chondroitinase-B domain-containing protein [Neiella holothuriorum]MBW8190251.1 alginate lyase [Neiella holothuriorum]
MKKRFLSIGLVLLTTSNVLLAKDIFIEDDKSLKAAIKKAVAGDNLILKNGTYNDMNIVFYGEGTEDKPITLKAETPGEVFIEGLSNLQIGGSYLNVEGLHFRNGYTPSKVVVSFKIDDERVAYNSKFTNNVIEEFTQKDREIRDQWIALWGQHNEISNNFIAGKSSPGPTIMVELKGNEHIHNHHQITNNYFGHKPRQGGPAGETIQVGSSYTSMAPSYTNIENNLFEYNNGEVEIISSKSNHNQFKNNVFFESEGSLVLRHGNYSNIDGNIFIGDGENEHMGGIRVINTGHWITNNYFYKLKGEQFRAPIAVMNGIPYSPLNRYNQVTDVVVAYNTWVETATPWHFSVGSNVEQSDVLPPSEIRSARPDRTVFANNLIYNSEKAEYPIHSYDEVDGIKFVNNVSNHANKSSVGEEGIAKQNLSMTALSDYLMVPGLSREAFYHGFGFDKITTDLLGNERANGNRVGAIASDANSGEALFDRENFGPSWFSTAQEAREASVIKASNSAELIAAVAAAQSGDVVELTAAHYTIDQPIEINKQILIKSSDAKQKATLNVTAANTAFLMLPKGNLHLDAVVMQGNGQQNAISTLDKYMSKAYDVAITNSELSHFDNVLDVSRGSFADTILVENSTFTDLNNGFMLNKETQNRGTYNVEHLTITNSSFDSVEGMIVDYHRGGYDESTIGGNLVFKNNVVTNSGKDQAQNLLIKNHGIVNVTLKGNTFKNNPVELVAVLWGEKDQKPVDNKVVESGEITIVQNLKLDLMY